jgi:hypothetical protein
VRFRSLLSIIAHASVPDVLAKGMDLWATWRDGPAFTLDLVPLTSAGTTLAAWLPIDADDPVSRAALAAITPFAIWGLILRIIGVSELLGAPRHLAFAGSAPAWLLIRGTTVLWEAALPAPAFPLFPLRPGEEP